MFLNGSSPRFKQVTGRSVLYDNPRIISMRERYLEKIKRLRDDGWTLFFTDETWCFKGMSHRRDWVTSMTPEQKKTAGLCSGPNAPPTHGPRLIVLHTVGSNGFLPGALRVFHGNTQHPDYHREMNADVFEQYVEDLIPTLRAQGEKVALVMDNASYHSRRSEEYPRKQWKKEQLVTFLEANGAAGDMTWSKNDLYQACMEIVAEREEEMRQYKIDKMLEENGVKCVRLPPYHCEFNPIELCWSWIKNEIRKLARKEDNLEVIDSYIRRFCESLPPEIISNYFSHVVNVENEFLAFDAAVETKLLSNPKIVIKLE
ncbi:hypothetical protein L596_026599 [Steinernema carpocapsae]|uniref:Tc1-like transposase DDE domain-containing protein n=1 Tax=Steinernema carpocapsae TaxID=34508 RepID=A0A4V5ZY88_STECR|nr:hypothetical protein L596_026599 [Steinernema carpocapsae]